jgi:hypothetical protein
VGLGVVYYLGTRFHFFEMALHRSHSVEKLKQKFEAPLSGMGAGGGGNGAERQYYEDDVRFWRERALRLGELARPMGSAADQYSQNPAQAPHYDYRDGGKGKATADGANGGGGYDNMDWDLDRDFSADAGGSPYVAAAAAAHRGGGKGGGGGGGANDNGNDGSGSNLDQLLKARPPAPSNQDPARLRQHVELHETVAALHGIAADLVERSHGIEARQAVRPDNSTTPCPNSVWNALKKTKNQEERRTHGLINLQPPPLPPPLPSPQDLAERKAGEQIRFARALEARVQAAAAPLESRRDSLLALASDVEALLGKFVGILAGIEPEPRGEDEWSRLRVGVERTRRGPCTS